MTTDFYKAFKDTDRLAGILKDLLPPCAATTIPPEPETFGDALETSRVALNLSSVQLAQKLDISTPHLESYLDNKIVPPAPEVKRIATIIQTLS